MPTAKVISPHSGGHCECGSIIIARRAKAQSKAQPWPGRLGMRGWRGSFIAFRYMLVVWVHTMCSDRDNCNGVFIITMRVWSPARASRAQPRKAECRPGVRRCTTIEAQSHLEDRIDDTRSGASGV